MASLKAPVGEKEMSDSGVRRLREMLRQRSMAEPMAEFDKYVSRARARLDLVAPEIARARVFIESSEMREDLDEQCLHAETVSARVVVSLYDKLEELYSRSTEGKSTYPLKCISVAANTLAAYMRKGRIIQAGEYPGSDALLISRILDSRVNTATEIQDNISMALDGSLEKFGLSLPDFPAKPEFAH